MVVKQAEKLQYIICMLTLIHDVETYQFFFGSFSIGFNSEANKHRIILT